MFILFLALWTISFILAVTDWKTESTRWGSITFFLAGCGGLSVVVEENIGPFVRQYITDDNSINFILAFSDGFLASLSHCFGPYALLMFSLSYSEVFVNKSAALKTKVVYLLLLPVILMYIFFPISPSFKPDFVPLSLWVTLYVLATDYLLVFSCIKAKDSKVRQQRTLTCIIVIPPIMCSLLTNYILRALGIQHLWRYNSFIIVLQFLAFVVFSIKYGVMGIKLKVEKNRLDSTMRAMTSGTAILNHAIKNEVMKIIICADNLKSIDKENDPYANENLQVILNSGDHMLAMVKRIQESMQDIILYEVPNRLADIIDNSLHNIKPYIINKSISVNVNYACDIILSCDTVHMREVLNNIFKNAIEAMEAHGELSISLLMDKSKATIVIKDNGSGISKENLPHIIDPFFSTKNRSQNFGLGLSYCYNVIQKHKGSLEIDSELNLGTTVTLSFPPRKILKLTSYSTKQEVVYG
ncbi:MAG: HAMP domain-containing histidine kinase [Clostridia bacterium]|nr:HAMP domain-containing histidine kinase [Clostridia bacterium]